MRERRVPVPRRDGLFRVDLLQPYRAWIQDGLVGFRDEGAWHYPWTRQDELRLTHVDRRSNRLHWQPDHEAVEAYEGE